MRRAVMVTLALAAVGLLSGALGASASAAPASLPALVVTPTTVTAGATLTVRSSGCTSDSRPALVRVTLDAPLEIDSSLAYATATPHGPHGGWSATLTVPRLLDAASDYSVNATCVRAATTSYPPVTGIVVTAQAKIALADTTLLPGAGTTLQASGFSGREHVRITLDSTRTLAIASTDNNGELVAHIVLPAQTSSGNHRVVAIGRTSGLRAGATVTVTLPPSQCAGTSCEPLAETGVSSTQLLITALLLLLGGIALWTAGISDPAE